MVAKMFSVVVGHW